MKGDVLSQLLSSAKEGSQVDLGRLLTLVENIGPKIFQNPELLNPKTLAYRVGITGPPGAGKSTLIDKLLLEFAAHGLKIAVLAVDPSSPFSHGAVLGDRVRYTALEKNENIFVRSIGSRGSLGGLCAQAYLMLRVFDVAKFDLVLIETVGVGQTELEIMNVADSTAVVLVPESGDGVQAMKAGLLEIADLFVVNKSDRPGADSLVKELEWISEHNISVLKSSATQNIGIKEVADFFLIDRMSGDFKKNRWSKKRIQAEAQSVLRLKIEHEVLKKSLKYQTLADLKSLS